MEITGKIVNVLPTLSGQGKNGEWAKNSFVIEWQDNGYKQLLCLEVVGADKFEKMKNAVKVGYEVLCKFSVSSREWNGKYFTTANCLLECRRSATGTDAATCQQRTVTCGTASTCTTGRRLTTTLLVTGLTNLKNMD